jgi:transcriptional regulator with PAS, ATPase and Fis domain
MTNATAGPIVPSYFARQISYVALMSGETRTMKPIAAPAGPSSAGLVLLYADPFDVPSTVPLTHSPFVVGREPPPGGLRLKQTSASRVHAKLVRAGDGWRLTDLGSRNGTFADGARVTGDLLLESGSEIRIGDALFKFVSEDIESYAAYRINGGLSEGFRRQSTAVPELVGGLEMDRVALAIEAAAPTDLPVLVRGETGTGKELVAHAVHRLRGRRGALCAINCAAVPANLFESELFGFRKGAFTGADRDKPGIVQAADGGTLFLDEIGDMPLEAQAKLLRVLEAHEVRAVGATRPEPVDIRVVCATHRDLAGLVDKGEFRGDLFARLHGYEVVIPPLRARKEDLFQLVRHFLARAGRPDLRLAFGFMLTVCDYDWPYNVRECESAVRRAVAMTKGDELGPEALPEALREHGKSYGTRAPSDAPPGARSTAPTADELRALLTQHDGNVAKVARVLKKDRAQVHRWMRRHGISPGDFRE